MNANPHRFRPCVERLEDRDVPANYSAATVSELIAAIDTANLTSEADTITLAAGKAFTLTQSNNFDQGDNGLPVIAAAGRELRIIGNGAVVERSTAAGTPAFRLFDVAAGASLTLRNLTLQGGLAFRSGGVGAQGGAVFNEGTLILDSVLVQNNTAQGADGFLGYGFNVGGTSAAGGGLYSSGMLTLADCTIQNNAAIGGRGNNVSSIGGVVVSATSGGNGLGGGLYVAGGSAIIGTTTFTGNSARGGNGGAGGYGYVVSGAGGDGFGGGCFVAAGAFELHNSSLTKNVAQGGAGGKSVKGNPNGATGQGVGGGIYMADLASVGLDAFTIDHVKQNKASTSNDNIYGSYVVIL